MWRLSLTIKISRVELARDLRALDRLDEAEAVLDNVLCLLPHQVGHWK